MPISQLETMTLSYIPLFAVTYFFWWVKPKDVMTPSTVELPDMNPRQLTTFEAMALSKAFDSEGESGSPWMIWALTPRVFEQEAVQKAKLGNDEAEAPKESSQHPKHENEQREVSTDDSSDQTEDRKENHTRETIVAYWDPALYHSKML